MGIGVAVAVAGGLGSLARYGVHSFVVSREHWPVPAGTFVVNVLGSFLLGYLIARYPGNDWVRLVIGIGFLGGFTTFSTLALELYRVADGRSYPLALGYAAATVLAGFAAVYGGVVLGRLGA